MGDDRDNDKMDIDTPTQPEDGGKVGRGESKSKIKFSDIDEELSECYRGKGMDRRIGVGDRRYGKGKTKSTGKDLDSGNADPDSDKDDLDSDGGKGNNRTIGVGKGRLATTMSRVAKIKE